MPETGEPAELVLPGFVEFRPPLGPLPPLLFHEHRAGILGMPHLTQNLGAVFPGLGLERHLRLTAEPVDPLFGGNWRLDKGAILAAVEPELARVRPAVGVIRDRPELRVPEVQKSLNFEFGCRV